MASRLANFSGTPRFRRLLLYGTLAVLVGLVLLAALFAALPSIVSTRSVQTLIRQSLEKSLKRQVTWSDLTLSWSDGLAVRGLSLGAGPAPFLRGGVGEAVIVPKIGFRHGRPRVDLLLRLRSVTAELAPGPPAPPKPYREPLTAIAEALQRFEKLDWPLPLDLGAKLEVEPVNLSYSDPQTGRKLSLKNGTLHCDAPSLADLPVAVQLHGDLDLAGHRLEALSLTADLKHLVDAARHLHPSAALVTIHAALPGTSLTLQGGLKEPGGINARARLDLPRLMAAAVPFLPPALPAVRGEILLDLRAQADGAHNLQGALEVNGSRIALQGGRPRQGRVGPLSLRLRQKFASDLKRQQVRFTDGSATVDSWLQAAWAATVDRPSSRERDLTAQLGPVRVDLKQLLAVAGPLLPPRFPVSEVTGDLTLKQLQARLQGRKNRGEVTLSGLSVSLHRVRLAREGGKISADGVDLAIDKATAPLAALQPTGIEAALTYAVRRFALAGADPLVLDGVRGGLQLSLKDLDLRSSSPRKVAGTAQLKQSLDVLRIIQERKLTAANLHEELTAQLNAGKTGEIELSLPLLKVSAAALETVSAGNQIKLLPVTATATGAGIRLPAAKGAPSFIDLARCTLTGSLQARASGKQIPPLPISATATAAGIRLPAERGASPSVERADCTVAGGDFLQLAASGRLPAASPRKASTDGTLRVDLDRALPFAAPFLPKGVAAGGVSTVTWNLALPTGLKPPQPEKNPLRAARAALAQVERGVVAVSLANRAISYPLASGKFSLGELRTQRPVRMVLPGKGGKISLEGVIEFAGLSGLPGSAGRLPAQSGSLSLNGELADWQSLRLHDELRMEPLGVVLKTDAAIGRIDALLERREALSSALLLQRLDATFSADAAAHFPTPTALPGGAKVSGDCTAGVRINLAAGRDLRLHASAATRGFGARLSDGTTLEGVRADLLIDRSYALARGETAGWTPLSASLVRPLPEQVSAEGVAEIANRMREDLRGGERGSSKFSIRRLAGRSGGTPFELTSLEGDLLLTPKEIGLSFFQAETLGGTVRLQGVIDLKPEVPAVTASSSFTNLETFLLLPPETREKSARARQETEITGEVSFAAPLVTGQRELLEGMRMRMNLRKIGADTLERALFSLDPHERNEQLVAQRKLLRHGTLKWLRASVLDGAFSLDGNVQVKGVDIALPKVERIRLSELAIQKQMVRTLAGIASARKVLDLVRADTIVLGAKGEFALQRRGHE